MQETRLIVSKAIIALFVVLLNEGNLSATEM